MCPEAQKPEACPHREFYFPPCKVPLATGAVDAAPSTPRPAKKKLFFFFFCCFFLRQLYSCNKPRIATGVFYQLQVRLKPEIFIWHLRVQGTWHRRVKPQVPPVRLWFSPWSQEGLVCSPILVLSFCGVHRAPLVSEQLPQVQGCALGFQRASQRAFRR